MKPLTLRKYSKYFLPLSILIILSLIIWFAAPFFSVENYYPLEDAGKRSYLICLLYLLWAIKIYLFDIPHTPKTPALPADQLKKIDTLQKRFKGAIQFLKHKYLTKEGEKINLFQLPWYLLLGPQNSGKTTLLGNSTINYVLAKPLKSEQIKNISPSESYDWWVTRNLVLVDVPSSHLFEEKNHFLWKEFLNLIKKSPKTNRLNGVVITLHLPELIKQENLQQNNTWLVPLKKQIMHLQEQFGKKMPFYLTITKCDLLPGFIEFFDDATSDELAQTWGITIPPLDRNEKLIDLFSQRFNMLIKRLNRRLISRLHQERNQVTRPAIKDFPLQIERLKESMVHFLKNLDIPDLNLQGIYLTSAIQFPQTQPAHQQHLAQYTSAHHALQILAPPPTRAKSFFIRQLLTLGLLNTFNHMPIINRKERQWQRRIIYSTAIIAIIITAVLFGHDFQQGVQQAYSLQNLLSQYQITLQHENTGRQHLSKTLPLLDALDDAAQGQGDTLSKFSRALTFYTSKSQKTAAQIYHQSLQTIVIPETKNILEAYLQNPSNKNPVRIYSALKAYLMLNHTETMDSEFVLNTLTQLLPEPLDSYQREKFRHHLNLALSESPPVQLNNALISKTRKLLFSLSRSQLAFIILKNIKSNSLDSSISLGSNLGPIPTLTTKEVVNSVPNMFTASYFQQVLNDEIPDAASEALHGNTVLGESAIKPTPLEEIALAQELAKEYVTNYIDLWESLLANIQIVTPHSLAQTDLIITTLTSDTSPLILLLQTLQQNTNFAPILTASPKLQVLDSLLDKIHDQKNPLFQTFIGLKGLHSYLQPILYATNSNEAAYFAAKTRIQHPPANDSFNQMRILADKTPDPIKHWLLTLTDDGWHFVLENASLHIQQNWKNIITTSYAPLANRFPFKFNATEEVNTQEFISFFNPQGTLSHFYQTYLKLFVNDATDEWEWKKMDNAQLPFSTNALKQIQHAMALQHALFPNNDDKLFVAFTLKPVSIDKDTNSVSLNINGQFYTYVKSTPRISRSLIWPGNNLLSSAAISFSTSTRMPPSSESIQGQWAWFRLVNKATKKVISPKELSLTFTVNNHTADYLLNTQGRLNPFLPLNWERVQLPEELL